MRIQFKIILQFLTVCFLLIFSWIAMQFFHEAGHVFASVVSGGIIEKINLHSWEFSQTYLLLNPYPLWVAVAGPVSGVTIPLIIYVILLNANYHYKYIFRFLTGFCMLVNGIYIGIGCFINAGDAFDMMKNGVPLWMLCCFGACNIPLAFYLWHGEGKHFGFGDSAQFEVESLHLLVFMTLILVILGFII